jgi:hypothetical protein
MKRTFVLPAAIGLTLTACDTMTRPISTGDFDPLRPPGSDLKPEVVAPGPGFQAGQFVRAAINNTAFFKERPQGEADADKLLNRGVSMKVISTTDSYVQVELDSGEVGYVPSVMLEDPNAAMTPVGANEYQVYPPIDSAGLPFPAVPPVEEPPGGAIPTVIDPEAPPGVDAPVTPIEPVPLPPNDEELQEMKEKAEATPEAAE